MLRDLVSVFIDLVVPPRGSERLVRALTLGELRALEHEDGLPYHDLRVTALIWELKYYGNERAAALAGAMLKEKLISAAAEELGRVLLVPVPMHPARRRERGHNQTELLCAAALKALGSDGGSFQYAPGALARVRATPAQQGLARHARLTNVRGSMHPPEPSLVDGRACIVVDDVTTSGATFAEAKRALRAAGARAVHTIALARS